MKFVAISTGIYLGVSVLLAPAEAQTLCPAVVIPVCAKTSDGVQKTYNNSCEAKRAGAKVVSQGQCEAMQKPAICTDEYKPVCAADAAGKEKTYSNKCQANAAGAKISHSGACGTDK